MSDLVGRTLGGYRLETPLGKGGMATVYRAYQEAVKRYVAVKVMAADLANDPGFIERFTREAEVIAALQHPHILPIIDYGQSDGLHYLVMQYLEGGSLEDRMQRQPLTLRETGRLLDQIASALDYAHKRSVVHRDFKASNVLLDNDDNVYLTDFGIARLMTSSTKLTATGTVMGTPAYMSPEQAVGRPVDGRSDIYSLGVVVYEMITHRLPFISDTPAALIFQHVYEAPPSLRQFNAALPASIEAIVMRALEKEPDARYQTAGEMATDFNEALRSAASVETPDVNKGTLVGIQPGGAGSLPPPSEIRPRTPPPTPGRSTPPPPIPPQSGGSGGDPLQPNTSGGANPNGQPTRRFPIVPVVLAVVVILAVLGVGGIIVTTNQQNQNATATSTLQTYVAMLALSATKTPTDTFTPSNTPTYTNTPTDTFTPSNTATSTLTPTYTPTYTYTPTPSDTPTFTPSPTDTPNRTLTAIAQQFLTTTAIFSGQTATAFAGQTQIAVAQQQTSTAAAIQTINAQNAQDAATATTQAQIDATSTAFAAVPPTDTPVSETDTPIPQDTDTPAPNGPQSVIQQLVDDGTLTSGGGSVVVGPLDQKDVTASKANQVSWTVWDKVQPFADFVMSADITWNNSHSDDSCGFFFRYNEQDSTHQTFHAVTISPDGHFYTATQDSTQNFVNQTSNTNNTIQQGSSAQNNLMVIGQGNTFRVFVNGKRISQLSPKSHFNQGTVAVAALSGNNSGLVCHFANLWAWKLSGSGSGNATGTPTNSGGDLASGLMASDPNTVIKALANAGLIPTSGATQVVQEPSHSLSISTFSNNEGGVYHRLTNTRVTNLVLSVDLSLDLSEDDTCGLYYDSNADTSNWLAIFIKQDGTYRAYTLQNNQWSSPLTLQSAKNNLVQIGATQKNRITLVVVNSKATVFINGQQAFTFVDHTFDKSGGGGVGYYMEKVVSDSTTETCAYNNATLWKLP